MIVHKTKTQTDVRSHFKETLDIVSQDHITLLITRQNGHNVVMMSEEDYLALDETAYLLRSKKNANRLKKALETPSKKRIKYDSIQDLENELRI